MKRNQMIKLMEYPLTDAGNAARLHEIFGKKWVYMPKFRKWMQWDGHCLQTVKAETLCLAAAEAFENLAAAICHLPATADPQEQKQRLAALNWLLRSRVPFHTRTAVKELKKLQMAEQNETHAGAACQKWQAAFFVCLSPATPVPEKVQVFFFF